MPDPVPWAAQEDVSEWLRTRIREGAYFRGWLPAASTLCRDTGASRAGIGKAIRQLAAEGWVAHVPYGTDRSDGDSGGMTRTYKIIRRS